MTFRIVPRTEIGLPARVTNSSGSPRPPLSFEKWLTSHYTGVHTVYNGRDVPEQVRHIQRIFSASKPFEYNYVIGQTDDLNIYEFAGKFQAAHSGGENGDSFGVLFLNGVGEPLTRRQIRKYQWLRDVLIFDGSLRPNVIQLPHREMPGAATICPGPAILAQWAQLLQPFANELPEPPEMENDMQTEYLWRHADHPEVFHVGQDTVRHLNRAEFEAAKGKVAFLDDQSNDALYHAFKAISL